MKIFPVLFAAILLAGCSGINKMVKNAELVKYSVQPEILELHGGEVEVKINGEFPPKFFVKSAELTLTPVIVDGEKVIKELKPIKLQGEKVQANNKVISYDNGGDFAYTEKFAFEESMRKSELKLKITAAKGSKSVSLPEVKLADGVIATPNLVQFTPQVLKGTTLKINQNPSVYDPNASVFQREVPETVNADILYLIQQAQLRNSELKKEDLVKMREFLDEIKSDERLKLENVAISSYASPDGALDLNTKLSDRRGSTAENYIKRELKRKKLADADVKASTTAEDWEGFEQLVRASNIQDKEVILRVLSMYKDVEVREKEIKNISAAYVELAENVLPQLRRSKYFVNATRIGKSDEEIAAIAANSPDSLNPAELLHAAELVENQDEKLKLYQAFSSTYPSDWRGPNNEGYIYFMKNDLSAAKAAFEKAKSLENNSYVMNNLGACELLSGNVEAARNYFMGALGADSKVAYNLGMIQIKEGAYADAVKNIGNVKDFNAALAALMNGSTNDALAIIDAIPSKSAMDYYLKAVIGARTSNNELLISNLKTAISKESSLAGKAKTDLEFYKFFETPEFAGLVK